MIDIHTHILPGIDDGSNSVELSHKMLNALYSDGVREVVFTPHFYWEERTVDDFIAARETAYNKINFPQMQTRLGAEVQFGELRIDYTQLSRLCIEDTGYILLELPFSDSWDNRLFDNITALRQNTDAIPVIAHIERYPAPAKKPRHIQTLLSLGCLLQVNAVSVLGAKEGSLVDVLLKNHQIQALATDCHNMSTRKPCYGAAEAVLKARYGQDVADYIQRCMQYIMQDKRVRVDYIHHIKKTLFSYR